MNCKHCNFYLLWFEQVRAAHGGRVPGKRRLWAVGGAGGPGGCADARPAALPVQLPDAGAHSVTHARNGSVPVWCECNSAAVPGLPRFSFNIRCKCARSGSALASNATWPITQLATGGEGGHVLSEFCAAMLFTRPKLAYILRCDIIRVSQHRCLQRRVRC